SSHRDPRGTRAAPHAVRAVRATRRRATAARPARASARGPSAAPGQAEDPFGEDALLDLRRAAVDGRGPRVQIEVLPRMARRLRGRFVGRGGEGAEDVEAGVPDDLV